MSLFSYSVRSRVKDIIEVEGTKKMQTLFSVKEAAKILEASPWTLRKSISRGHIRVVHLGRNVRIRAEELERIGREGLPSLRVKAEND